MAITRHGRFLRHPLRAATFLRRPTKDEYIWVHPEARSAEAELEIERHRSECEATAEIDSRHSPPDAWHTLFWDRSDPASCERLSAWLKAHRRALKSIPIQHDFPETR